MAKYRYSRKTADGQVKASAGFLHTVTVAPLTATPTAGLLSIYDSATESGAVVYSEWVLQRRSDTASLSTSIATRESMSASMARWPMCL